MNYFILFLNFSLKIQLLRNNTKVTGFNSEQQFLQEDEED
jgi:hypothetical protein